MSDTGITTMTRDTKQNGNGDASNRTSNTRSSNTVEIEGGTLADGRPNPFIKCSECESIYRRGSSHACDAETTPREELTDGGEEVNLDPKRRADREKLIEKDESDPGDIVLILRGRPSSYHEFPDENAGDAGVIEDEIEPPERVEFDPDCNSHHNKREYIAVSREYAQRKGCYPCRKDRCRQERETKEADPETDETSSGDGTGTPAIESVKRDIASDR